jgi:protein O-GlcNAc transferase
VTIRVVASTLKSLEIRGDTLKASRRTIVYATLAQLVLVLGMARSAFAQESATASKKAMALYQAGSMALSKNDLSTALRDFQEAVQLEPASGALRGTLGFILLKTGNVKESVPQFEAALKKNPFDFTAGLNLAVAYEQMGQPEKAVAVFATLETAARTQNRAMPANFYLMYARDLVSTQQVPAAIVQMRRAVDVKPQDAGMLDSLGSLYAMQQSWPEAERNFRAALSVQQNMASAQPCLAKGRTRQRSGSTLRNSVGC